MKKRNYKQNCALALASDILCERWTLLIFRELLIQPCRFKQLNLWLAGMGTNLLAQRLKELEGHGLIQKQDAHDKRSAYELTVIGRGVEPLVFNLIRWGLTNIQGDSGYCHYHHWDLLAMKALFRADKCARPLIVQFECDQLTAWVRVSQQGFDFSLGKQECWDIHLAMTIADLKRSVEENSLKVNGEILDFIQCFDV